MKNILIVMVVILSVSLWAEEPVKEIKEEAVETQHSATIDGKEVAYKATAGNLVLKDDEGKDKGSIFYVAYMKNDVDDFSTRPITFCFNGGPGSSSVWLHLGAFGPKKVPLIDGYPQAPYVPVNNPSSLLDVTDLIFIDPVSTGYSRAAPGVDSKQFHGVEEDIQSVSEFIRLYLNRYNRWNSPKYLAGESYGTTRAAGVAGHLYNKFYLNIDGIILVSSVLNFQAHTDYHPGNDLPNVLFLPSYTAAAWYHNKLPEDLQKKELREVLKEAEDFTMNEFYQALLKGNGLTEEERLAVSLKVERYTGLSPNFIDEVDLRFTTTQFAKELLRANRRRIGRFDSRYEGFEMSPVGGGFGYDPSADAFFGPFTTALNYYLRADLGRKSDEEYKILANVWPWNFGKIASNQYLNVAETLKDVMNRNPNLRVFVASGYYDLATPYFATLYTFSHLGLDPELVGNVQIEHYEAGHMPYFHQPSIEKMKRDLSGFYKQT